MVRPDTSANSNLPTSALQVDIGTKGESLVFTPTRNGGTTGPEKGYHDLPAASVAVPLDADDNSLAMALAEAWARCI